MRQTRITIDFPTAIKEAIESRGCTIVGDMESAIAGARTCHIIPLELRAAWALGNYKKAQEIFEQAGTAMKPILKNIEHGKDKAISAAPAEQGPEPERIAEGVVAYIAASLYVRLAGHAVSHATQLAATKLAALTGGFLGEIALHSLLSTLSSMVAYSAASVVGLVVGTSINLVLLRTYRLQVQLLNWDEVNDWVICEWYGDNAEVAGKQDCEEVQIPRLIPKGVAGNVAVRNGCVRSEEKVVSYAILSFQNKIAVLGGLGITLGLKRKDKSGTELYVKYDLRKLRKNKIGRATAIHTSGMTLEDCHNTSTTWASIGTMSTDEYVDLDGTMARVQCGTPELTGQKDNLYTLVVNIGGIPTEQPQQGEKGDAQV